jgi:hypothetical protein
VDERRIKKEIELHRRKIEELEEQLEQLAQPGRAWIPERFYTAYHALAGIIIGAIAAWVALAFNALGSEILHRDPFRLMKYYATIFTGDLTEANRAAALMVAIGIHTITGALCGAPIHVVASRFFPGRGLKTRAAWGVVLGLVMWLVNFYGVLSWLQPLLVGRFYIGEIPVWVAALTHVSFAVTVLVLQPLGAFDARSYLAEPAPPAASRQPPAV